MPNHKPNEQVTNFFLEELCGRADEVYRFAYLLTLHQDAAARCVDASFDLLLGELGAIMASDHVGQALLKTCWQAYQKLPNKGAGADTPLGKCLAGFALEERAAVGAVDIWGLSLDDAAKALKWDRPTFCRHLAQGRQKLSSQSLEQLVESPQKGSK